MQRETLVSKTVCCALNRYTRAGFALLLRAQHELLKLSLVAYVLCKAWGVRDCCFDHFGHGRRLDRLPSIVPGGHSV